MNVYDQAHGLAKAIKESEEYKQYKAAKERAEANPELNNMLQDFQQKQVEFQAKQMMGEPMDEEMMKNIQSLYGIVMQNPQAAEYMQHEMRFSMMINDVYQILGEVISMGIKPEGQSND